MLKREEVHIEQRLEYYKNLVYTEDDIKSAKNDRSDLNKAHKISRELKNLTQVK